MVKRAKIIMSVFNSQKHPSHQIVRTVSYPQRGHAVPVRQPVHSSGPTKAIAFLVMSALLVTAGIIIGVPGKSKSEVKATSTTVATVAQAKPAPPKKLDFTTMNSAITAEILKYSSMDVGVSVIDIKTGDTAEYGVQNPFVAASTAKMLTAIAYLHDVEQGKATLTQQVGNRNAKDALQALIVDSDNVAWDAFNNGVMSHTELAAYATSIGLSNYNPNNNTITPTSVAKLLSDLYQEKLLNHEHTQLLLTYMSQAKEVEFITNTVPTGTKVYHKPGYLADRVHDAAIIDNGKRPYVLIIFSKSRTNSYNMTKGGTLFKNITLATLSTFNQN
jgi:beta-lactamase class A